MQSHFCYILLVYCLLIGLLPQGQISAADGASAISTMDALDDERVLKVGDRLLYQVREERESPVSIFVNDRGEIMVPLIGAVQAAGKTARSLAYDLKRELEQEFFYRATVLIIPQYAENSRGEVSVAGAVRWQRAYPIPNDQVMTVSAAITAAGGMSADANAAEVTLVRRSADGAEETRQVIDLQKVMETGDFALDLAVQPGDLVIVPRKVDVGGTVFVVGAVNSPGILNVPPDGSLTVSKAILQSAGFSRFARQTNVKLIRGDSSIPESERTIVVNVEEILQRGLRDQDPVVKANDIIRVEERIIAF